MCWAMGKTRLSQARLVKGHEFHNLSCCLVIEPACRTSHEDPSRCCVCIQTQLGGMALHFHGWGDWHLADAVLLEAICFSSTPTAWAALLPCSLCWCWLQQLPTDKLGQNNNHEAGLKKNHRAEYFKTPLPMSKCPRLVALSLQCLGERHKTNAESKGLGVYKTQAWWSQLAPWGSAMTFPFLGGLVAPLFPLSLSHPSAEI